MERIRPQAVRPLPISDHRTRHYERWIRLSDSMTRTIGEFLNGPVEVSVLREGPDRLAPWERRLLRPAGGRRAYAREVMLSVSGRPVLRARTLGALQDPVVDVLRSLNTRPLAERLFEDRRWQRASPAIPVIDTGRSRIGRACLWRYEDRPPGALLVTEYFEPILAE
jgi:chorismate-pyruvate lyase